MSFPLPDNILQLPDVTAKQIMKKVFSRQNAGVSRSMKKMGFNYKINYGVTIPQLREIAGNFTPDHALAVQLRTYTDIREALILSSMLDTPELITYDEALLICEHLTTIELVEQYSRNLFAKINNLTDLIRTIISKENLCISLSFMSFGWALKFNISQTIDEIYYMIELIRDNKYAERQQVVRSIKFVMQVISDYSEEYNGIITKLAEDFSRSDNSNVAQLGNEYLWLNTN